MKFTSRTTLLGAFAATTALLSPSFAAADPQDDISSAAVNTTCSFDQIETALKNAAPKFWDHISADPDKLGEFNDKLRAFLDKSPEDRRTAVDGLHDHAEEWAHEHPDKAKWAGDHKQQFRNTVKEVLNTCSQY